MAVNFTNGVNNFNDISDFYTIRLVRDTINQGTCLSHIAAVPHSSPINDTREPEMILIKGGTFIMGKPAVGVTWQQAQSYAN